MSSIKNEYNFNKKHFTTLYSLTKYVNVEYKKLTEKPKLSNNDKNFLTDLNNAKNELVRIKKDIKAIGDKKLYNAKKVKKVLNHYLNKKAAKIGYQNELNNFQNIDFEPSYNKTHEERIRQNL